MDIVGTLAKNPVGTASNIANIVSSGIQSSGIAKALSLVSSGTPLQNAIQTIWNDQSQQAGIEAQRDLANKALEYGNPYYDY